ncbi:MAG: hypothetical protein KAI73_10680 [Rhodospirillaceae bacterium]|nr:hypothetical protein [Rhodospirillaceae bacterium]
MASKNDSLLLALGWKQYKTALGSRGWENPDGAIIALPGPRPYDSVDDAIACVPSGWAPESMHWSRHVHTDVEPDPAEEISRIYCSLWNGKDGEDYRFAPGKGATEAEALSNAIMKALEADK